MYILGDDKKIVTENELTDNNNIHRAQGRPFK